jgi:hypothetical protein
MRGAFVAGAAWRRDAFRFLRKKHGAPRDGRDNISEDVGDGFGNDTCADPSDGADQRALPSVEFPRSLEKPMGGIEP